MTITKLSHHLSPPSRSPSLCIHEISKAKNPILPDLVRLAPECSNPQETTAQRLCPPLESLEQVGNCMYWAEQVGNCI